MTDEQFIRALYGVLAEAGHTDIELGIASPGVIVSRARLTDGTFRQLLDEEHYLVVKASMSIDKSCISLDGRCDTPVFTVPPPWWS